VVNNHHVLRHGYGTGLNWLWQDTVQHSNEHFNFIEDKSSLTARAPIFWSFFVTVWKGYDFNTNGG
jgi:hypothetical protein